MHLVEFIEIRADSHEQWNFRSTTNLQDTECSNALLVHLTEREILSIDAHGVA